MASESDLGWLAGWWDGEGSIGFVIQSRRQDSASVILQATNTHLPAMEKSKEMQAIWMQERKN